MADKRPDVIITAHIKWVWQVVPPLSMVATFILENRVLAHLHWPVWAFVLVALPLGFVVSFIAVLVLSLAVTFVVLWIDHKRLKL